MGKSRDYVPCRCRSSVVLFQRRGYSGRRDSCGGKRCCQDEFLVRYSFAGVPGYQRRCSRQQQFLGYRKFEVNAFSNLSGDYVGANSVLAGATQLTGSEITNGEAENFVKTFTDVTIPSGDIAFLFTVKPSMTRFTKVSWR